MKKKSTFVSILRLSDMAMGPRFDFILYKREGVPSRQLNKIRMGSKPTFGALICLKFYNNFCPAQPFNCSIRKDMTIFFFFTFVFSLLLCN